jgi:hypothetical protein
MRVINHVEHPRVGVDLPAAKRSSAGHARAEKNGGQSESVVTLLGAATPSGLYGAKGVVANVAPHGLPDPLALLRQRLRDEYPDLRVEARHAIEARLHSKYGVDVDADKTWFNTFAAAAGSSRSYNGWQHNSKPLTSLTLTDLQLQNFPAGFGEDQNGLNANSGVYRTGPTGTQFNSENEVRLLSSDLKAAIHDDDFQATYRARLAAYWARNEGAVALHYEALALEQARDGSLSAEGRALLAQAAGYQDACAATWRVYAFDIDTYVSKDMTWLQADDGRVILLMPHAATPLHEYASVDAMRRGIAAMARTEVGRDEILRGFSLYNQQDGVIYQGVEKWLGDIATGGYDERIAMQPKRIEGNLFADMACRAREAALDDVSRLTRSNADVDRKEWLQALHAVNNVFGNPVTLLGESGYALYASRTEGLLEDRQDAASQAWMSGLGAAVMVLLEEGSQGLSDAEVPGPNFYYKPPTRLSGGRIGYPLSPVDPPRLPTAVDAPGTSGRQPRPSVIHQTGLSPSTLEYARPAQEYPLDLRREHLTRNYREPPERLPAPRDDMPAIAGADGRVDEALDLSTGPRRAAEVAPQAARVAPQVARVAPRVVAIQPRAGVPRQATPAPRAGEINSLGFRERYNFGNLYGYQAVGGIRMRPRVADLDLAPSGAVIPPMVDGDMLLTFRTAEEAEDAARAKNLRRFFVYRVNANGLRAAAFSEVTSDTLRFSSLEASVRAGINRFTPQEEVEARWHALLAEADLEVHLSAEGLTPDRIDRIQTHR